MKKAIIIVFIFFFSFLFFIPKSQAQTSPSCSSLAVGNRTNIVSGTTANVTPGQSVDLVANIANDNGNRNNSSWGASGGTYSSKNWDYATWVAPSTPGNYSITYALSGVNQTNCSVVFRVPAPTPSCSGIKISNNTPASGLLSGRSYTFQGNNCQNATSYQWVIDRGSCFSATFPSSATTSSISLTMPTFNNSSQQCTFTPAMRACNGTNCSQYYSIQSIVKYALPVDAKQWTFNIALSCQNGATPINTTTNTSWNFLNSAGSSICQPNAGESRGSTRTTLTFSETFTSAPSLCSQGVFNISKIAEGEAATFKDASSSLITAKANDPGTATWPIASLPAGTYAVNYYLPASSCPTPTGTPKPSPCNGIGDVNNDGFVTEADALLVLRHLAGFENFTADQLRRANVNGGGIDTSDALSIRRFIAGLDTTFLACPTPTPPPATTTTGPTCPLKPQGDANCDQKVNIQDFLVWKGEFLTVNNIGGSPVPSNLKANFNNSATVDIQDFLIWKAGFLNPNVAH
ncbi:MAG: dockerin type I repeat-containing protein [Candidatus Levybacteria bacterium]|nr:dockerin type I repeat-containing protein [Candidatus Levybacteria bacterium]